MNNKWIEVKDRKPCNQQAVLAWRFPWERPYELIYRAKKPDNLWTWGHEASPFPEPTHWQPLPDPPPKPDAFEEWWRTHEQYTQGNPAHEGCRYIEGCITSFYAARAIWTAALASKP